MSEPSLQDKFDRLQVALDLEHVERTDEIHCALLAMVAGCTFFLLGEPGIAKSMLSRRIHAYVEGGRYFDHDMDRFSVPEDLFGPRSLAAMREDRWERVIDGTLVTADWCFLDEFFEASSALLKTLLRTLNEREYHQGTEIIPMSLTTVFAASNEIPSESRLMPLYDRLLLRRHLSPIQEGGGFVRMLGMARDPKPEPLLSWDEVLLAQDQAERVVVPPRVHETMADIRRGLAEVDIHPSDRRFYDAQRVIRASAWLDRCSEAEPEHLRCLTNILWSHPDQISVVDQVVDTMLEPLVSHADELLRSVHALDRQIRVDLDDADRMRLANELHSKTTAAHLELKTLRAGPSGTKRQEKKLDQVEAALQKVSRRILVDLFQVTPEELATRGRGT